MRVTITVVFAAAFAISVAAQDFMAPSGVPAAAFPKPDRPVADIVSPIWHDEKERDEAGEPGQLVGLLGIRSGMTVADIGAGSGYLAKRMAPIVAPGRVLAVDVQPQMVDLLKGLSAQPGLANIVPILGAPDDSRLALESVDLAVMVDVYHELAYPYEVVRSIIGALKPGGRLVFVEYRGEDPRVPIKSLHKMTVAQIRLEMQQFPLTLERTAEDLPIQHIVVFRKQ